MIFALRTIGSLFLAVTMVSSVSMASEKVTIETLEGTRFGKLREINSERLIFSAPRGKATIPLAEVIELRWNRPRVNTPTAQGEVVFTDESIVPHTEWEINDGNLRLRQSQSTGGVVDAPLDSVRCWRLPSASTPAAQAQWQNIGARNGASDRLVLQRRGSESIDAVEGVIKSCDAEAVQFEYEGEVISVPWNRVYGLIFFRQAAEIESDVAVVYGPGKLRLRATRLEANSERLRLTRGKRRAELPLAAVTRIDLSAGKTQRLSEATVIESDWKPYLPSYVVGAPPQRNAAFDGGPLRLRFLDERADGVWRVQTFEDGWALRSQSHVTLKLKPWARQLRGWIGIDPATAATGSAEVTLLADGETLLSLHVDGSSEPVELSLSVEGVQQLTLKVDYGENLDTGDNIHFVDLRVTR